MRSNARRIRITKDVVKWHNTFPFVYAFEEYHCHYTLCGICNASLKTRCPDFSNISDSASGSYGIISYIDIPLVEPGPNGTACAKFEIDINAVDQNSISSICCDGAMLC